VNPPSLSGLKDLAGDAAGEVGHVASEGVKKVDGFIDSVLGGSSDDGHGDSVEAVRARIMSQDAPAVARLGAQWLFIKDLLVRTHANVLGAATELTAGWSSDGAKEFARVAEPVLASLEENIGHADQNHREILRLAGEIPNYQRDIDSLAAEYKEATSFKALVKETIHEYGLPLALATVASPPLLGYAYPLYRRTEHRVKSQYRERAQLLESEMGQVYRSTVLVRSQSYHPPIGQEPGGTGELQTGSTARHPATPPSTAFIQPGGSTLLPVPPVAAPGPGLVPIPPAPSDGSGIVRGGPVGPTLIPTTGAPRAPHTGTPPVRALPPPGGAGLPAGPPPDGGGRTAGSSSGGAGRVSEPSSGDTVRLPPPDARGSRPPGGATGYSAPPGTLGRPGAPGSPSASGRSAPPGTPGRPGSGSRHSAPPGTLGRAEPPGGRTGPQGGLPGRGGASTVPEGRSPGPRTGSPQRPGPGLSGLGGSVVPPSLRPGAPGSEQARPGASVASAAIGAPKPNGPASAVPVPGDDPAFVRGHGTGVLGRAGVPPTPSPSPAAAQALGNTRPAAGVPTGGSVPPALGGSTASTGAGSGFGGQPGASGRERRDERGRRSRRRRLGDAGKRLPGGSLSPAVDPSTDGAWAAPGPASPVVTGRREDHGRAGSGPGAPPPR
jgi:hypothetical protein